MKYLSGLIVILTMLTCSKPNLNRPALIGEPLEIIIKDVIVSNVSQTLSTSEPIDENSPPDVFIEFYTDSGDIIFTDTINNIEESMSASIFTNRTVTIDDPRFVIDYFVYDKDEGSLGLSDDLIERGNVTLFSRFQTDTVTSVMSGTNLKIEWVIENIY